MKLTWNKLRMLTGTPRGIGLSSKEEALHELAHLSVYSPVARKKVANCYSVTGDRFRDMSNGVLADREEALACAIELLAMKRLCSTRSYRRVANWLPTYAHLSAQALSFEEFTGLIQKKLKSVEAARGARRVVAFCRANGLS